MRAVCVFCGSSPGRSPAYAEAARLVGRTLAAEGITVVYGGAGVGTMGELARSALAAGGRVVGVIPEGLTAVEMAESGLTELHRVTSMHERKQLMADLADGFLALPGGLGTVEELAEITTWAQLGLHAKPIALLDVDGFWQPLLAFLDHAVEHEFLRPEHRELLLVDSDLGALLTAMRARHDTPPPPVGKWWEDEPGRYT